MTHLNTSANLPGADDFYADLLALHDGRSTKDSTAINARLILLLANHIGDRAVLREAMDHAVNSLRPFSSSTQI